MRKRKVLRAALVLLLLLELLLIFCLSHEPAAQSDETSGGFTAGLLDAVDSDFSAQSEDARAARVQGLQKGIRTLAHLSEYTLLGFTAAALALTFECGLRGVGFAVGGCALWAVGDEVHQAFVPGRSCQVSDVAVDVFGVLLGAAAMWLLRLCVQKLKERKNRKDG